MSHLPYRHLTHEIGLKRVHTVRQTHLQTQHTYIRQKGRPRACPTDAEIYFSPPPPPPNITDSHNASAPRHHAKDRLSAIHQSYSCLTGGSYALPCSKLPPQLALVSVTPHPPAPLAPPPPLFRSPPRIYCDGRTVDLSSLPPAQAKSHIKKSILLSPPSFLSITYQVYCYCCPVYSRTVCYGRPCRYRRQHHQQHEIVNKMPLHEKRTYSTSLLWRRDPLSVYTAGLMLLLLIPPTALEFMPLLLGPQPHSSLFCLATIYINEARNCLFLGLTPSLYLAPIHVQRHKMPLLAPGPISNLCHCSEGPHHPNSIVGRLIKY